MVDNLGVGRFGSNIDYTTRAIKEGAATADWTDCLRSCIDNDECNYFDHRAIDLNRGVCWLHHTDERKEKHMPDADLAAGWRGRFVNRECLEE